MNVDPILEFVRPGAEGEAVIDPAGTHTYGNLHDRFTAWRARLDDAGVKPHAVVSVEGDYSVEYVAALLALAASGTTVVPISARRGSL